MKIGLVGQSYQEASLPFDAQRTINMYPVMSGSGSSAEVACLYSVGGKSVWGVAGDGAIRVEFASANGRAFVVSNDTLYEVDSAGTATSRGTLNTTAALCTVAENSTQLAICDGTDLYIFTYASNAFAEVTDIDFPGASTVTYLDGYFIVSKPSSGQFYISALNDGTSWDALDFATAESDPDNLVIVKEVGGQLLLGGVTSSEIWYSSGAADFPFARMSGIKIEVGFASAHTARKVDNSLMWVSSDKDGQGVVVRMQGNTPVRISTSAIEIKIQELGTDISALRSYTYQQKGRAFYIITSADLETSLCYDVSTRMWHERAYLNSYGDYEADRASCSMFAFGKHLLGDRENGNIYELSDSVYADNDDELSRERIFTHIINEQKRTRFNELEVLFEAGVGLTTGQGSDPQAILQISTDLGKTWGPELWADIGAIGNYGTRAVWRRLGISSSVTFRIRVTDPVKVVMIGAYLK